MPDPTNDDDDSSSGLAPRAAASLLKGDGASGSSTGTGSLEDSSSTGSSSTSTGSGSSTGTGSSRAMVPTTCELPNVHVTAGCTSVVAVRHLSRWTILLFLRGLTSLLHFSLYIYPSCHYSSV